MIEWLGDKALSAVSTLAQKSATFRMFSVNLGMVPAYDPTAYKEVVKQAYRKNPYVFAAINETAASCAGIPPILYRVEESGPVERAMQGYERKGVTDARGMRRKRAVASALVRKGARRLVRRTGCPEPLARAASRKALVQTGSLEEVDAHELLDVLHRPNGIYQRSYQEFIKANIMHLELGGETFIEPVGPDSGLPRRLYALPPKNIEMRPGIDQPISEIIIRGAPRNETFEYDLDPRESEILFIKYYNPLNPVRGLSPAAAASQSVGVNNEGRQWNLSLLQNGAMPSGIVTARGSITETQADSLRKKFNERHAGSQSVGKLLALDEVEGLEFEPMSMSGKDMLWGELNRVSGLEVAVVWGVPPEIIGDSESKTYSNYAEARRAFYLEKVTPTMDFLYGELNANVVPLFGDDLWLDYDASVVDALQDDLQELHERIRADFEAGLISLNEGREAIGREELDNGDIHLVGINRVPLDVARQGEEGQESSTAYPAPMDVRQRALEALGGEVRFFDTPDLNGVE